MTEVARVERGWLGHYILGDKCMFRRNTLLVYGDVRIVISSVGALLKDNKFEKIGIDHHYETMAFVAQYLEGYWDANVTNYINLQSPHRLTGIYAQADNDANAMHETCVAEIEQRLLAGEQFIQETNNDE